jgi:hypothetical protein
VRFSTRPSPAAGRTSRVSPLGLVPVLGADADLIEAPAWLHDIGYGPGLAFTGLHQFDGAWYLRDAQHAGAGDGWTPANCAPRSSAS